PFVARLAHAPITQAENVIPGRRNAPDPESRGVIGCNWIPGSPLRAAPEGQLLIRLLLQRALVVLFAPDRGEARRVAGREAVVRSDIDGIALFLQLFALLLGLTFDRLVLVTVLVHVAAPSGSREKRSGDGVVPQCS